MDKGDILELGKRAEGKKEESREGLRQNIRRKRKNPPISEYVFETREKNASE